MAKAKQCSFFVRKRGRVSVALKSQGRKPMSPMGAKVMKFNVLAALLAVSVPGVAATPELPFTFVENQGQVQSPARVLGRGSGMQMEVSETWASLESGGKTVRIDFPQANPRPALKLEEKTGAVLNFLVGADSSRWRTNLAGFRAVRYADLWPGIDVVFRADGAHVNAEYHLRSGADAAAIRLQFGVPIISDADGGLKAMSEDGELALPAPQVFLENGAVSSRVPAS